MVSPRPVPFSLVEKYGSKIFVLISGASPQPLSATSKVTTPRAGSWLVASLISPSPSNRRHRIVQ